MLETSAMKRWSFTNPTLKIHRLAHNYRQHPDLYKWSNQVGLSNSSTPQNRVSLDPGLCQRVEQGFISPKLRFVGAVLRRQLFFDVDSPSKGLGAQAFNPRGVAVIARMVQNLVVGCQCSPSDIGVASFTEKDSVQLQQAIAQQVQGVLVTTVT